MKRHAFLQLAVIAALAWWLGHGLPSWAASEPARSLDDELLESLGADPIDEFDRELFAPDAGKPPAANSPAQEQPASGIDREELKRQLLRELGEAAEPEDENPLAAIARRMREVEGRIAQTNSGEKTQDLQNRIVADLDELIKQCRSCCSKQSSGAQRGSKTTARRPVSQPKKKPGSTQARRDPKASGDPTEKQPGQGDLERPDMDEMKDLIKAVWGELPESEREQMLQWMGEGEFLPKYELLIERYFRRLNEPR